MAGALSAVCPPLKLTMAPARAGRPTRLLGTALNRCVRPAEVSSQKVIDQGPHLIRWLIFDELADDGRGFQPWGVDAGHTGLFHQLLQARLAAAGHGSTNGNEKFGLRV